MSEKYRLFAANNSTPPPNPLLTGLKAYWKMEEATGATRVDATGNGHDLTDVNSSVTQAAGIINNGAGGWVNADDQFLEIADTPDLSITGTDSITIAGWIFPTVLTSQRTIITKGTNNSPSGNEYHLSLFDPSPAFLFWSVGGSNAVQISTASIITVDAWNFLVCWFDNDADLIAFQVNNGSVTSDTMSAEPQAVAASTKFGRPGGSGTNFDGTMDEFGIWKRVLTADERTELYNSGVGITHPFA